MFEPVRGGTRGGQAEFKWADVAADKDREHYLGHSINAPAGRWQKNKDIHWYSREQKQTDSQRAAEIRRIKELEADALSAALGFVPTSASSPQPGNTSDAKVSVASPEAEEKGEIKKEEKRRRKEERKERKRARREMLRLTRRDDQVEGERRQRHSSRSRSPRRQGRHGHRESYRDTRRALTPPSYK